MGARGSSARGLRAGGVRAWFYCEKQWAEEEGGAGGEGGVEDGVTKIRRGVGNWMEGGGSRELNSRLLRRP